VEALQDLDEAGVALLKLHRAVAGDVGGEGEVGVAQEGHGPLVGDLDGGSAHAAGSPRLDLPFHAVHGHAEPGRQVPGQGLRTRWSFGELHHHLALLDLPGLDLHHAAVVQEEAGEAEQQPEGGAPQPHPGVDLAQQAQEDRLS